MASVQTLFEKLESCKDPTILFTAIDGTLYAPGLQRFTAPIFNMQTARILHENFIPFIVVTGRRMWNRISDIEILLHGLFLPDVIICAAGTEIFRRTTEGNLEKDRKWEALLLQMKVTQHAKPQQLTSYWNVLELENLIQKSCLKYFAVYHLRYENKFTIRITIYNTRMQQVQRFINEIKNNFSSGLKLEKRENLIRKNTLEIFSGDIIIIPQNAGKDNAIMYILSEYFQKTQKNLRAFIFGNSSIDTRMLSMKSYDPQYRLLQFGVNLTPLAKQKLQSIQTEKTAILTMNGPQAILKVLQKEFH
jgi:hydroxymethylpyrimidine pyrophosphatase-like HAD family hydrolase